MKRGALSTLVGRLRDAVRPGGADVPDDDELLRRWSRQRDEAAFELLVWRHGRLVLGVCQRILRSPQDVEDAFQATFLVLVRKGANILRRQAVASWLYMVAYRISLEARSRRRAVPLGDAAEELPGREAPPSVPELREVLDEEVRRLPEKYRLPFVLCHLQGRTNEEAARELGRPVGTILSRLSRARERLRERLTRRGLNPAALAAPWTPSLSALPDLVCSTTRAALSITAAEATAGAVAPGVMVLMEGAVRTMFVTKLKALAAVVVSVALLGGGGAAGYRAYAVAQDTGSGSATGGSTDQDDARELRERADQLTKQLQQMKDRETQVRQLLESLLSQIEKKKAAPKAATSSVGGTSLRGGSGPLARNADLEDEVELLKARLKAREAALRATMSSKEESARRYSAMTKARQASRGSVSDDDYAAVRITMDRYHSEVVVKEAELLEAQILLKQAERRLKAGATASSTEQRLKQLEDRVSALEAELKRTRPATGSGGRGPSR
jgi:RNA polymerase sigma factor (sigma-70 family)